MRYESCDCSSAVKRPAPTKSVRRAILVAATLSLAALFASGMRPPTADCSLPFDAPRALNLDRPDDRDHLAADLAVITRTAEQYRRSVATLPAGHSIHAIKTSASRPDRAYQYCVAVLTERIVALHHLDPARTFR